MAGATKRGDTLIEVVLSFVIFSLVAAISLAIMHAGISGAESSIELTLARVEIDAQSETVRFIQESFANDRAYTDLWHAITKRAIPAKKADGEENDKIPELSVNSCSKIYDDSDSVILSAKAFVVNPRRINNGTDSAKSDWLGYTLFTPDNPLDNPNSSPTKFSASSLNPRIIYTTEKSGSTSDDSLSDVDEEGEAYNTIYRAEGIYDFITKDTLDTETDEQPRYFDLHVYTCWFAPGASSPTTIGTVTRLFNPEFLDGAKQ